MISASDGVDANIKPAPDRSEQAARKPWGPMVPFRGMGGRVMAGLIWRTRKQAPYQCSIRVVPCYTYAGRVQSLGSMRGGLRWRRRHQGAGARQEGIGHSEALGANGVFLLASPEPEAARVPSFCALGVRVIARLARKLGGGSQPGLAICTYCIHIAAIVGYLDCRRNQEASVMKLKDLS